MSDPLIELTEARTALLEETSRVVSGRVMNSALLGGPAFAAALDRYERAAMVEGARRMKMRDVAVAHQITNRRTKTDAGDVFNALRMEENGYERWIDETRKEDADGRG